MPIRGPVFRTNSYGYRRGKSAIEAVHQARQRCWRYDWVLDLDIKGFFDSIDWELLLKAVRHHTDCPWVLLYIERWLKASKRREARRWWRRRFWTVRAAALRSRCLSLANTCSSGFRSGEYFGVRNSLAPAE